MHNTTTKLARRNGAGGDHALVNISQARALLAAAVEEGDYFTAKKVRDQAQTVADHIKRVSGGREDAAIALIDAAEVKLRAERALGELDIKRPKSQGARGKRRGDTMTPRPETLTDFGFTKEQVKRWRDVAKIKDELFEAQLTAYRKKGDPATTAALLREGSISSGGAYDSDEWYTPADIIDDVRKVLVDIDLDPASCAHAQKVVKAAEYFTKKDDGLTKPWWGRVWLNPPYSQPGAEAFARKLLAEYEAGTISAAIMVQNAGTETSWFQALAKRAALCLPSGRINFDRKDGESSQNRYAQVFFYLGLDDAAFMETFAPRGLVGRLRGA